MYLLMSGYAISGGILQGRFQDFPAGDPEFIKKCAKIRSEFVLILGSILAPLWVPSGSISGSFFDTFFG